MFIKYPGSQKPNKQYLLTFAVIYSTSSLHFVLMIYSGLQY